MPKPTLVSTKMAWIEAMTALSPEKARPILQRWTKSPDGFLALSACEALDEIIKKASGK